MLSCLLEELTECLVREVSSFQDCYKKKVKNKFYYNLPPNKIALFCTAVQCLDLFLLIFIFLFYFFCFALLFLRLFFFLFFVRPWVCREIPKCSTDRQTDTLVKKKSYWLLRYQNFFFFYQSQEENNKKWNKKPTRGVTAGR